jgi:hypothetical protein
MRNFGLILMVSAGLAFFYAGQRQDEAGPVPPGLELSQSLQYPGARWELLRYASATGAFVGLLLAFFPKGR